MHRQMNPQEIKSTLKELFTFLSEEDLDILSKSNEDINVLITRVLDNNYKPITIDVKDIEVCRRPKTVYKKEINYPEVFYETNIYKDNMDEGHVSALRMKAQRLHEEANELMEKGSTNKLFAVEYFIEADKKRENADVINKEAATIIMQKSIQNRNNVKEYQDKHEKVSLIDLHGLYKKEAMCFVEDLYNVWKFKEINFVTGQKMKNRTLRPALEEWFEANGFYWYDLGAIIKGKKK